MERMIDWLWNRIDAITTWRTFFFLLLSFLAFNALFYLYSANYPVSSFDGQKYGVGPADIRRILAKFDEAKQLDRYLAQETQLDLAFPAIYGLLWAVMIVGLRPRGWHWLVVLPLAAALFDYCENFTFIALVIGYRKTHAVVQALAVVGSIGSRLKWTFVILSLAAPVVALVRRYR